MVPLMKLLFQFLCGRGHVELASGKVFTMVTFPPSSVDVYPKVHPNHGYFLSLSYTWKELFWPSMRANKKWQPYYGYLWFAFWFETFWNYSYGIGWCLSSLVTLAVISNTFVWDLHHSSLWGSFLLKHVSHWLNPPTRSSSWTNFEKNCHWNLSFHLRVPWVFLCNRSTGP